MARTMTVEQWLEGRKIDARELTERTGLDDLVVTAIVARRYTPSPKQRQKIAAALEVGVDEIDWGHVAGVDPMYGHGPQFGRSP